MGRLFEDVCAAVRGERYAFSRHATERLRQRRIPAWQATSATVDGRCLSERTQARPNPTVEVEILLADGVKANAVWAWVESDAAAMLITVHFLD